MGGWRDRESRRRTRTESPGIMAEYTNGHTNGYGSANGNGHGRSRKNGDHSPPVEFDKLPPQNLVAELSVLGSLLLDNETLHDVVPLLKVEDFYRDSHQVIYRAIRDLYDLGKAVDAITLIDELSRKGDFEKAGGDDDDPQGSRGDPLGRQRQVLRPDRQATVGQSPVDRECATRSFATATPNNFTARTSCSSPPSGGSSRSPRTSRPARRSRSRTCSSTAMDRITARAEDRHAVTGVGTGYYDLDEHHWRFPAHSTRHPRRPAEHG